MSRTTSLGTIIASALAFLALSAAVAQAVPARSAAAELTGPFIGTYTGRLTQSQAAALGDARMQGTFRLVLRRNGTYTASNPLDGTMSGRLAALSGKKLRFFRDTGCIMGDFERPKGGIYAWSVNGRRLTLRLVSEGPCTGRTQTLAWVVWTRR